MDSMFDNARLADALRRRRYMSEMGAATGGIWEQPQQREFDPTMTPSVERQKDPQILSQNASNTLMDMAKAKFFGGGLNGAQIGQAAKYYGPEVAKMGGTVSAPSSGGAGFMGKLGGMFGGGGAGGGGGIGGASGGFGGGAAAAGPWAALAAAIMLNEEHSRKKGLRAENRGERLRDQLTGKVVTQDIEGKWGPMMDKWTGGRMSKWGLTGDMKGASQLASGRFGPGFKTFMKEGTPGKLAKALKRLF